MAMTTTFIILAFTVFLFLLNKIPIEITALCSAMALVLFDVLESQEMLDGFSNSVVITIAALFVVGAALFETGVAENIANKLIGLTRGSESMFMLTVVILTAVLSGFLSNTGTVAVMIPTVIAASKRLKKPASNFLLPVAFAASIGGMLTLIGSPPNIVVSNSLQESNLRGFAFFEFAYLGLPILLVYIFYVYVFARGKVQKGSQKASEMKDFDSSSIAKIYDVKGRFFKLRIRQGSRLIGNHISDYNFEHLCNVSIVAVEPHKSESRSIFLNESKEKPYHLPLENDDVLIALGEIENVEKMVLEYKLGLTAVEKREELSRVPMQEEIGFCEAVIPQRSNLNQQSVSKVGFYEKYRVRVMGIMRNGKSLKLDFKNESLHFGDQLLLLGSWSAINQLKNDYKNFIIYGRPQRLREADLKPLGFHAWLSIAGLILMVLMLLFKVFPMVVVTILIALFLILTGCISLESAYRSVSWQSVILIAAMIPMSTALNKTGGAQFVADKMVEIVGGSGPLIMLTGIFLITNIFSQFISNTATTILITPIAMKTAESLSISPYPVLMMVAAGASAAFMTPIASPVNTLVLGPGGYSFSDFVKKGAPLILLVLIVSLILIPVIWPLGL